MGNGQCEQFNRTLRYAWFRKSYVSPLVFAYNSTRHESTGQSPFMLMFGGNPRLPIDAALGLGENQQDIRERPFNLRGEKII